MSQISLSFRLVLLHFIGHVHYINYIITNIWFVRDRQLNETTVRRDKYLINHANFKVASHSLNFKLMKVCRISPLNYPSLFIMHYALRPSYSCINYANKFFENVVTKLEK